MNRNLIFKDNNSRVVNEVIKTYFLDGEAEPTTYLPNTSKINIIIGSNNSGKSRFMRYLMQYDAFDSTDQKLFNEYNGYVRAYNLQMHNQYGVQEQFILKEIINNNHLINVLNTNASQYHVNRFGFENIFRGDFDNLKNKIITPIQIQKRYYMPTLRTAHSLFEAKQKKIENDIFLLTLNEYYNLDKTGIDVFTGIHLYKEILNARNSKREVRNSFDKFEKFISKNFFDGKQIDIVAEFDKDESLGGSNHKEIISVHIDGENETRKLFEMGDGIQAIIILMYKIFMAEPNSFIFIDEPELNLHPGMQRLFLEQISKDPDLDKKNLTYFISTHSNHFLDLSIEKENVSIYSFLPKNFETGDKQFIIKNVNEGDNLVLKQLGVNNSSVFMANCSIWVEGVSDRNYIKAFLKSYTNYIYKNDRKNYISLKEDIDFAFFEYAGSNVEHYVFEKEISKEDEDIVLKDIKALALNNRIFLLADSDLTSKATKKGKRLTTLEATKTDDFIPKIFWNIREVENLLTTDIWGEVLIELCNKSLVKGNEEIIQKRINEALLQIKAEKYTKEFVGEFLEALRIKIGKIGTTYILNQSTYEVKISSFGTIINKRYLSEIVFNKNFSWEILSKNDDIKQLTTEIYDFIITSKKL